MEIEAVGFGNVVSQPLRQQGADAVGQREREIYGVAQRLTDEELEILFSLARPIAQEARQGFLAVVAGTLVRDGQRGPDAVWRAARSAQSAFLLDVRRAAETEGTSRYSQKRMGLRT
jgi:hypothetical protein